MKKALILAVGTMLGAMAAGAQTPTTDVGFLLKAYTRFVLAQEVQAQAQELARPRPEAEVQAITAEAKRWMAEETEQMRAELADRFGQAARDRFSAFVAEYTAAEKDNDLHYLGRLAGNALLGDTPFEFPAMRRLVLEKWLTQPFADGGRFLGEIQTWIDLHARNPQTPPLAAWLARNAPAAAAAPAQPPANPLAAAEAEAPAYVAPAAEPPANPMDAFAQSREAKRARALEDAQAGMQQMAMERQAAEQEYSAKKLADAQADAEAMRAQSQKIAAVEQEAIDQRANSWMGRLKNIVSATVGAATGAFTGGVGAEAGRQAADAIFHNP